MITPTEVIDERNLLTPRWLSRLRTRMTGSHEWLFLLLQRIVPLHQSSLSFSPMKEEGKAGETSSIVVTCRSDGTVASFVHSPPGVFVWCARVPGSQRINSLSSAKVIFPIRK